MEEKIIDKETIQKERRVMENSLKEYFDYRGQVIKDNWNDEFVKYSSSFLRGDFFSHLPGNIEFEGEFYGKLCYCRNKLGR